MVAVVLGILIGVALAPGWRLARLIWREAHAAHVPITKERREMILRDER